MDIHTLDRVKALGPDAEKVVKWALMLEGALHQIADGHVDTLGTRRNHFRATSIARKALGMADR